MLIVGRETVPERRLARTRQLLGLSTCLDLEKCLKENASMAIARIVGESIRISWV